MGSFIDDWRKRTIDTREVQDDGGVSPKDVPKLPSTPTKDVSTRRIYAANYRNKHKERINQQRRDQEQEPLGAYKKARRRAKYKKQKWDISFENWFHVWNSCPKIYDDEMGIYRHAWQMRSGDLQKGTQMRRIDPDKGWMVTNVEIVYRNQPVPAHGVVALWDYKRGKPGELTSLRSLPDGILV